MALTAVTSHRRTHGTDYERIKRILVPKSQQTGPVLPGLAYKYGFERIGQGTLSNDILIAMSAARLRIRVFTSIERDNRKLAEFRPLQWQVVSF